MCSAAGSAAAAAASIRFMLAGGLRKEHIGVESCVAGLGAHPPTTQAPMILQVSGVMKHAAAQQMRAVVLRQRAQEVQGLLRGWWACACTATTLGDDAAVQQLLEQLSMTRMQLEEMRCMEERDRKERAMLADRLIATEEELKEAQDVAKQLLDQM